MAKLILVRHGESTSNRDNIFTGWNDVSLTKKGIEQAKLAGQRIQKEKIYLNEVHTSVLTRAIKTAWLILDELQMSYLPINKTWRLNERHYGALRGINKDQARSIYGTKQVAEWRRNFYAIPPKIDRPDSDHRYQDLSPKILPTAESLAMSLQRILVYYNDQIAPKLINNKNQLIVAHGSTIRVLIKHFDQISAVELDGVEVDNGAPIIYDFDGSLNVKNKYQLN